MPAALDESAPRGLTSAQARDRLARHGPNALPEAPPQSLWGRSLRQLRDPMILLLLAAATLTLVLRDWPNTVIIAAVVVFNTAAGLVQQMRAEQAMAALNELVAPLARVRRDGTLVEIPAADVVRGDAVTVVAGDVVPADGRLVTGRMLQVDESQLTGESLPVEVAEDGELTGGTRVTRGRGAFVVTRTGADSGIGRLAALTLGAATRRTPLQDRLRRLSRMLVLTVGALTAVVMVSGLLRGRPVAETLVVGLSLAVAAVPESLPAVVTVALAMGARRMARRRAVVRSLFAVETLGSVTVVATDKTGTLTEGRMLAENVWTPRCTHRASGSGYDPAGAIIGVDGHDPYLARLLRAVVLCNDARLEHDEEGWRVVGDPLEGALLALGAKGGHPQAETTARWPRVDEQPFDHASRHMTTWHRDDAGRRLRVCKGAPEAVLALVQPGDGAAHAVDAAAALATDGYRVIAVADDGGRDTDRLELLGLVAIGDPPRPQSADVVRALRSAGVRLVLVTGDHPGTAEAVARRVGIAGPDDRAIEGAELEAGGVHPSLTAIARVRPEQKVTVVRALQADDEVVAMLGDGVNDAPALRAADIGVAAGKGGTEVARQAADLVLMDDDLATVVAAVEEGRRIYTNVRAFLVYAISGGLAEVAVMLLGPLVGLALPLLPGQILWINLLTHGLTGVAFGAEPADPRDMARPPHARAESVFDVRARVLLVVATTALSVTALAVGVAAAGGPGERRTALFLTLGLGQLGVALALRAGGHRPLRERRLELAVGLASALMVVAVYLPGASALLRTVDLPLSTAILAAAAAAVPGALVAVLARARRHEGRTVPGPVTSVPDHEAGARRRLDAAGSHRRDPHTQEDAR
jgi:P-type Ca2+ transporter type 2C